MKKRPHLKWSDDMMTISYVGDGPCLRGTHVNKRHQIILFTLGQNRGMTLTVSKTKMNSSNHGLISLTLVWLRRARVTAQDSIKWACHVTCEEDDKLYYCGAGCCKIHPWILRIVWSIGTLLIDPRAAHNKRESLLIC